MNRKIYISLVFMLVFGMTVSAQTYERIVRNNLWNLSENVTGIRQDSVSRSYAEIYGTYEAGGYRDTWQGSEAWSAGAATASVRHLEKMSLAGSFSFEQKEGYDMCGSMFIKPGFYPVDVLEFTPGRKTLQTYSFDGGISYDAAPAWRIGARMDFESANMAKRKDLRHGNWRLDMKVAPGFMYHDGGLAIGGAFILGKNSETINAEQIGTAESSYHAFLDKGLMYGVYSVWTGNGVHLDEAGVNGFPVKELSYGGSVQIGYKDAFAEIEYLHSAGTVGEKDRIWFMFPGNSMSADLGYRIRRNGSVHDIRLAAGWKGLSMDESVLENITHNGVTSTLNHGWNRILGEDSWRLSPEYEFVSDRWEALVRAEMMEEVSVSSQMYPYIFMRSLLTWSLHAEAEVRLGCMEIGAAAGFGKGRSEEEAFISAEGTGVQTRPYRLEDWYARHMEYEVSPRLDVGISAKFLLGKGLWIKAEGAWEHGFRLVHAAGADRFSAAIRLGYDF